MHKLEFEKFYRTVRPHSEEVNVIGVFPAKSKDSFFDLNISTNNMLAAVNTTHHRIYSTNTHINCVQPNSDQAKKLTYVSQKAHMRKCVHMCKK